MDISLVIENAFPGSGDLATELDAEIRANQNPMELPGTPDFLAVIPAYIQWCIRNRDNYGQLVTDWTINSIAEYGRAKSNEVEYLNFKFLCSETQCLAICAFLKWCLSELLVVHEAQLKRAIKHWC